MDVVVDIIMYAGAFQFNKETGTVLVRTKGERCNWETYDGMPKDDSAVFIVFTSDRGRQS